VSIVDGHVSQSVTHRFSVVPARAGTFTIGPIAVVVGNRRYEAAAVTLTAVPTGTARPGQAAAAGPDQLQLVLSPARTEVYLHERVPLRFELRVGNVRVSDLQYPSVAGDGVAIDKLPAQPAQRRDGPVQVVDFSTTLTPLRTGTLTVGPATMSLSLVVRSRSADPLFGGLFGQTARPIELRSEAVTLTVLPLPDAGRPADFSGAVGRFEIGVKAAPLALGVGDPVTVTSTIRGIGDLESVTPPAIAATDALRVYPVQRSGKPKPGERMFEQVVIPQRPGTIALPESRFSYFDPEARVYRTLSQPPITLTVHEAAQQHTAPEIAGPAVTARPAEKLGHDLVFIKDDPGTLEPARARRWRSPLFWGLQIVPLVAWLAAVAWDRRRRRLTGDVRWARFTRAGRTARHAIAAARRELGVGDHAAFYDALARAVGDYLAAKLDLPPGAVSAETVGNRLRQHGVPSDVARELEEFFTTCERARFAPSADGGGDVRRALARADAIVRALERERRLARAIAAACVTVALVTHAWAAVPAPAAESPKTIFFRANALYTEERYADAAAAYEHVVAAGLTSGNLQYNLGNAYMKAGDVGHAILAYERARRLIPGDPDLVANFAYARAQAGASDDSPAWERVVFPLAGRASTDTLLLAASVLYAVLMLALVVARLFPATTRGARVAAIGTAIALAVVLPSVTYRLVTLDLPGRGVVVAKEDAIVRFEPSATGTAHYTAKPGSVLRLVGERDDWVQVARPDGRRGWVERALVARI
jgi:tetratricopeptide (TPR) repeat protein